MGAVVKWWGKRLGVGVEHESMGRRTVCETSFEGDGAPAVGAVKRAGLGSLLGAMTCAGRWWWQGGGREVDGWMDAICELVVGHNAAELVSKCQKGWGKHSPWAPQGF